MNVLPNLNGAQRKDIPTDFVLFHRLAITSKQKSNQKGVFEERDISFKLLLLNLLFQKQIDRFGKQNTDFAFFLRYILPTYVNKK